MTCNFSHPMGLRHPVLNALYKLHYQTAAGLTFVRFLQRATVRQGGAEGIFSHDATLR